jgi:hypothetical protein
MTWLRGLRRRLGQVVALEARLRRVQESLGRIERRQLLARPPAGWHGYEFRVYSQWGEDGLIQHLVHEVSVARRVFVEFGVEDYREANTRFLLVNDNWSGLVMDASDENVRRIREDAISWQHDLKAAQAFITRENINELLSQQGLSGDIGLLSIDIDGNDYWVWQAITAVSPAVVVIEYNARFGPQRAVSVPYDASFERASAHYSMIYYGASLAALCGLGRRKGYALVGCNSAGNNAFFVRRDLLPGSLPERTPAEAFVPARFREARDARGALAYLDAAQEAKILRNLPVVEVDEAR